MRVVALILAAGSSRRMGDQNKLLVEIEGIPVVCRVAMTLKSAGVEQLTTVTGFEAKEVEAVLCGLNITTIYNPQWEAGMGSSLARGVQALDGEAPFDGLLVCLGDLPFLEREDVESILAGFREVAGKRPVVPEYQNRRGHPVILPRNYLGALAELRGETGAKPLIAKADPLIVTEVGPGVCRDVDEPEDFGEEAL